MFRKLKTGSVAGLAAAMMVMAVQACNEPLPTMPAEPVVPPPPPAAVVMNAAQGQANLSLGGLLGGVLSTTTKTVTTTLTAVVCLVDGVVADIGIDGGTISNCGNSLVIPANSLKTLTHIQLVPVQGQPGVVQFYPEGLQFSPGAKPTLTLNTDGVGNPPNAYIVYTDDNGNVKEVETTTGRTAHTVSAQIGHFSRYAVSW